MKHIIVKRDGVLQLTHEHEMPVTEHNMVRCLW